MEGIMARTKRFVVVIAAAAALAFGFVTPALASQRGCSHEGGPTFGCDDIGQAHAASQASGPGQGFPPGTTG
jgi:hypothetical protein